MTSYVQRCHELWGVRTGDAGGTIESWVFVLNRWSRLKFKEWRVGSTPRVSFLDLDCSSLCKWGFPKIGIPQNWWFVMENPIKMDDLGVPLFLETPKWIYFMIFVSATYMRPTVTCFEGLSQPFVVGFSGTRHSLGLLGLPCLYPVCTRTQTRASRTKALWALNLQATTLQCNYVWP